MCESMSENEIGEEEEKKKHRWGIPEYIPDEDFPPLIPEVAEALRMGDPGEPTIPLPPIRTLIKMVGSRKNAFIMLKFFYKRDDTYSAADLSRALKLHMCEAAVRSNLNKLCKVAVLKATRVPQYDKKTVYYTMANKEVIGYIVKDWLNRISYILAHYIPYRNKIRVRDVKEDKRFIEKANYYGLSVEEAVDIVKKCPHIEASYDSQVAFLSRNCQGYIEPGTEKLKAVEVEEAIPEEV